MIRYRTLTIENYKSIGHAVVEFTPGVFAVTGNNLDGSYSSNGSGKSSILQALTLVLYNRDFQNAPLDSISNRFTGKPFRVSLLLHVDRDGVSANYEVVNDRASKKLTIRKNGKMHSSTTAKSLKLIQDILGMSEATFKFTHYITTNSILELTNNLSNATLFNEVLQVTQLKTLGQDLIEVKKKYAKEIEILKEQFQELNGIRKLLKVTDKFNLEDLKDEEKSYKIELSELSALHNTTIKPLIAALEYNKEQQRELRIELRQKRQSSEEGVCSLCGTHLATDSKMIEIQKDVEKLEEDLAYLLETFDEQDNKLSEYITAYDIAVQEVRSNLYQVQKDKLMGEQLQEIHKTALDVSGSFSKERFEAVSKELRYKHRLVDNIDKARDAIRSGRIFEDIMKDFFSLVNKNIQKYRTVINLTAFDVEASSYKSGMVILLKYLGEEIPVESLSNGEKARLSLLVLSALLESMQQTTQSDSNFLLVDEATASFDKAGIKELTSLFEHLKALDQSVFVITHGQELDEVSYDGNLIVTKEDKVSTLEVHKK